MKPIKTTSFALGLFALVVILQSCGGGAEINGDIAALQAKKDSLRNVKNEVSTTINQIEDQIKLLDTTGGHRVPLVSIKNLESSAFRHYFSVQGFVETDRSAEVTPEVSAKVVSINVNEGDHVSAGQVIGRLDSKVIENSVAEVKSMLELAETVYNKQKNLWDQKIGSEVQFLEAKNNYESLKKRYASMMAQLEMYNIKAPFEGTVDEIYPKTGETVSPVAPFARVLNLSHVYIKADISERYLDKIKVGDTAIIRFPSLNIERKSTIARMGKFINPNNRTFKIRFELPNNDASLMPNLLAEIDVMDYAADTTVVIPVKLVQETPSGDEFVYLLKENGFPRAEKRMIKTGLSYKGNVEVRKGLKSGEKLITKGATSIKDGEIVEITKN